MSEYEKLMEDLMKMNSVNTEEVNKQIAKSYERLYKQYRTQLLKVIDSNNRLKEAWLRDQMKALGHELDRMKKENANVITAGMEQIINRTLKTQEDYFNKAASIAGLPNDLFTGMFSSMNRKVVQEVIGGNIYKDGRGLSDRVWSDAKQSKVDIQHIITEGINKKMSIYDVAKDLEQYVNPDVKVDYEWKKRYPSAGKKVIDYNAYRLATTSISHAYQTTLKRVQEANPFITGIEWSGGHDTNSCQVCKERNGRVYQSKRNKGRFTTEPLPLDHPNGLCKNIPYIPDDLDKVGARLGDWANGKPDKDLDRWFKNHGNKYTNVDDIQKEISKKKSDVKDDAWYNKNFNKIREVMPADAWNQIKETLKGCNEATLNWYKEGQKFFKYGGTDGDNAYYDPNRGRKHIVMDFKGEGVRGTNVFFHEFGHLIDWRMGEEKYGRRLTAKYKDQMWDLMQQDLDTVKRANAAAKVWEMKPDLADRQASNRIKEALKSNRDPNLAGISDIMSGLTDHKIVGNWAHSIEYWHRSDVKAEVTSEAIGNMSEALAVPGAREYMEQYFPEAFKFFQDTIIKDIR